MPIKNTEALTSKGVRMMMDAAIAKAGDLGVAVTVAIVDGGGHLLMLERMEGGYPIMLGNECIGGVGVAGGDWRQDQEIAKAALGSIGAALE